MNDETVSCVPQIGSIAPDFEATGTFGQIKLSDYKGKWVILFSHPGDFTPVCTTEFLAFTRMYPEFKEKNCELLGLSVDSNPSHLAWVYNIYRKTGIEIPFPIIDDSSKKIAKRYGMIHAASNSNTTVRNVYMIDPDQIIRAVLVYPMTTGRNIPEIYRLLCALQLNENTKFATPANWEPGTAVIRPAPKTYEGLMQRVENECNLCCMDWYLCFDDPDNKAGCT